MIKVFNILIQTNEIRIFRSLFFSLDIRRRRFIFQCYWLLKVNHLMLHFREFIEFVSASTAQV